MARSAGISVENSFVKGLITEATGLNFPENACVETYDCTFDKTGEVARRLGLQFENNFTVYDLETTDSAIVEYLWKGASKNGEITFVVLQIGNIINFFRITDGISISPNRETFSVDISNFAIAGAPETKDIECSFSSGNGLLFVAHPYCNPFYVEYSEELRNISVNEIEMKIRDIKGLDNVNSSGTILDVDYRPLVSEATPDIYYNLLNQGWHAFTATTNNNRFWSDRSSVLAYWNYYRTAIFGVRNDIPSEVDIWWLYKAPLIPQTQNGDVVLTGPKEAFSGLEIIQTLDKATENTPAPKGHFILDAFNQNRSEVSFDIVEQIKALHPGYPAGISTDGLDIETSGYQRPSQIAFFAGRVFYAGVASTKFNTKIYFTQILDGSKHVDECYQQQDPTSETSADLLPSDGGIIEIPDMAKVVKMFVLGPSLFIFATNGVWQISGSEGIGFTAVDYSVSKVSNVPALGANSFVEVDGVPMWWNLDGIWTVNQNQVISLTDATIKDFYADIPGDSKLYAKGAFNPFERKVQWLYRSVSYTDETVTEDDEEVTVEDVPVTSASTSKYYYDRVLNLDVATGAFYPWTIPDTCLKIVGIVVLQGTALSFSDEIVTVGGSNVTVDAEIVTVSQPNRSNVTSSRFKYVTLNACTSTASNTLVVGGNVGSGVPVLLTSVAGKSYTSITPHTDHFAWEIAYGDGLYAITGRHRTNVNAFIATSDDDGVTWTNRYTAPDFDGSAGYCIRYGSGNFVAAGQGADSQSWLRTSPDGLVWTERDMSSFNGGASSNIHSLAFGAGRWVALGSANTTLITLYSTDSGATWNSAGTPPSFDTQALTWSSSVAFGNGLFVAGGRNTDGARIYTSSDGDTWTQQTLPSHGTSSFIDSVVYGDGYFMASLRENTQNTKIIRSVDGVTWTDDTTNAFGAGTMFQLYNDPVLDLTIALGVLAPTGSEIEWSEDATTWTQATGDIGTASITLLDAASSSAAGGITFSEFSDPSFLDWLDELPPGEDYTSYFTSGFRLRGEASRKFQNNYINLYCRNEDPSTFDFYSRWDFANSGSTGRWSQVQRVAMDDTNYLYRTKRLKARGHGKALNFRVDSVSEEPFNIIGWSSYETVNNLP